MKSNYNFLYSWFSESSRTKWNGRYSKTTDKMKLPNINEKNKQTKLLILWIAYKNNWHIHTTTTKNQPKSNRFQQFHWLMRQLSLILWNDVHGIRPLTSWSIQGKPFTVYDIHTSATPTLFFFFHLFFSATAAASRFFMFICKEIERQLDILPNRKEKTKTQIFFTAKSNKLVRSSNSNFNLFANKTAHTIRCCLESISLSFSFSFIFSLLYGQIFSSKLTHMQRWILNKTNFFRSNFWNRLSWIYILCVYFCYFYLFCIPYCVCVQ